MHQEVRLVGFGNVSIDDPIFASVRDTKIDDDTNFEEWYSLKTHTSDKMVVRYTDGVIDSVIALRAEAQKVYMKDGNLKCHPRFKIELLKPANISIASSFLTAFCACTKTLSNEFKQSYITLSPDYEKMILILTKHIGFVNTGVLEDGRYVLLRNNASNIPVLRADKDIYLSEIFPVMRLAINDSLCSYYLRSHHLVKYFI